MPRNKGVNNAQEQDEELTDVEEELEEDEKESLPEEEDGEESAKKGKKVPKQAVNFDDKWIKENVKEEKIAGLLKAKRASDAIGDKNTSRKLRKALREAGFYVSKNRDE